MIDQNNIIIQLHINTKYGRNTEKTKMLRQILIVERKKFLEDSKREFKVSNAQIKSSQAFDQSSNQTLQKF